MFEVNHSDLERVKEAILPWLHRQLPEAEAIELPPLNVPGGGGSSQTLFLSPVIREHGSSREEHWVLRIQATSHQIYQDPSVERQFLTLQALSRNGEVPVPRVFRYEPDPDILGAPFFIMEQVTGRVPAAFYHSEGFFTEASAAERERMWHSAVAALANVHRTDTAGLGFLHRRELGSTGLDQEIGFWDAYREWNGVPPTGVQEKTRIWLEDHMPGNRPTGLAWGDARLPNMIFCDSRCAAVIDWETVSLGGGETDLGWWLFFDWYMTEGSGIPRLDGIPGPDTFIATWERLAGRPVRDMAWHEVFAIYRYSMIRDRALMLFGRQRPADFERTDPALRRLTALVS